MSDPRWPFKKHKTQQQILNSKHKPSDKYVPKTSTRKYSKLQTISYNETPDNQSCMVSLSPPGHPCSNRGAAAVEASLPGSGPSPPLLQPSLLPAPLLHEPARGSGRVNMREVCEILFVINAYHFHQNGLLN